MSKQSDAAAQDCDEHISELGRDLSLEDYVEFLEDVLDRVQTMLNAARDDLKG
jgi:hypothetical protein